ncbi:MAG: hypothetical protein LBV42_01900 [Methanobrevibacter sp.]|jgi:hypothetical protein|nr:hypothetical protein [Methanobrevibacter sp.]
MLKKILSILVIAIIAMSAIGSVSATSDYFDCYFDVDTDFEVMDACIQMKAYTLDQREVKMGLDESGLCHEVRQWQDVYGNMHYIYHADKAGVYTHEDEWSWPWDSNYITFHFAPHKFSMRESTPHLENGWLTGNAVFRVTPSSVKWSKEGYDVLKNNASLELRINDSYNQGAIETRNVKKFTYPNYKYLGDLGIAFDKNCVINIDFILHTNNPKWADETIHKTFYT